MVHPVQPIGFVNVTGAKPSSLQRVKNALSGRIFDNWRETLLSIGTVYYVIRAALLFFGGALISSLVASLTAGFMSILRKEIHDFANLRKETQDYRKQNMRLSLSILNLQQSIADMRKENQRYAKENAEHARQNRHHRRQNREYARQNETHQQLLNTLSRSIKAIKHDLGESLREGTISAKDMLARYAKRLEGCGDAIRLIQKATNELSNERDKTTERLNTVAKQIDDMTRRGTEALSSEVQSLGNKVKYLKKMRNHLRDEIAQLEKMRRSLQASVGSITKAAEKINRATNRNLAALPFNRGN